MLQVGDHRQLPPTIKAKAAERGGMATSLFERLLDAGGSCAMLTLALAQPSPSPQP
tara:strand:+ start:449 stop:616 length:168 start_codon:yes stop_codon:yes gene_type:complete